MKSAIILTGGLFLSPYAKTAHGLCRGSERFHIIAVIDEKFAGMTASQLIPSAREIPIYASLDQFRQANSENVDYCILGIANKGGLIPEPLKPLIKDCLKSGIHVINGLHQLLISNPEFVQLAKDNNAELIDIRKPKSFEELHFWSGKIKEVKCPKIAVLGTDCATGKRTTSRILVQALEQKGIHAEMIYTGQTGWMQGSKYGFIFDSTLNDFISGELEHAIHQCFIEANPSIIFIEGQSSLQNPSGPCGSEMILSADADGVILQVIPKRTHFKGMENYPALIPSPEEEIKLIEIYGVKVLAVTVNTENMLPEEAESYAVAMEQHLGIPVVLPFEQGVNRLIPIFQQLIEENENIKHQY